VRGAALALHQFRFDQKIFWRNPASLFFTVSLPVVLLIILGVSFGSTELSTHGGIAATDYYVPAIITIAVVSAATQSLAMSLVQAREDGRLKRGRGTPMPAWAFIAGRVGNSVVVSLIMLVVIALCGWVLFGVELPLSRLSELLLTLLVGVAAFSCLGIALTTIIPSQESAASIATGVILPLYFISGIFIPDQELSSGILGFANHFPVRPFFEAMLGAYLPGGEGIDGAKLLVVAIWGLAGFLISLRWFRWSPRGE
jgi:ABC-2 type transport system permease protein